MPDWTYRTFLRPALFALPPAHARDLMRNTVAAITGLPGGAHLIETFGDLAPPYALATTVAGIPLRSPVGLGLGLDTTGQAARAWESLGVGFIEVGPVTEQPVIAPMLPMRDVVHQALVMPDASANPGLAAMRASLARASARHTPLIVRLAAAPNADLPDRADEQRRLAVALAPHTACFALDWTHAAFTAFNARAPEPEAWTAYLARLDLYNCAVWAERPVFAAISADADPAMLARLLPQAIASGIRGIVVSDGLLMPDGRRSLGPAALPPAVATVRAVRAILSETVPVIAAGGITEPTDALALMNAGANAVQIAGGLVYSGPALARRIGETLLAARAPASSARPYAALRVRHRRWWHEDWPWTALLGGGMIVAGVVAWIVAAVRVILPYDEAFIGLTRAQLAAANPRLLAFMAHDRVTLAGTMISIGGIYAGLALGPMRDGARWARWAFLASAIVGFSSFALVLGYHYVDPLHALATLVLLPFLLLTMRGAPPLPVTPHADSYNDRRWLRAQWGQLALVALGAGFLIGGLTIATVGERGVFVHEDLDFLRTTATALHAINPRLVPLVAHDRAGFGGALISDGVAFLLTALWGIRRGAQWVWWTLLWSGLPGFVAAVSIHAAVGYDNLMHLAPVGIALVLWAVGLGLSYGYCADTGELRAHRVWQTRKQAATVVN